jgi:hypothetical protein
VYKVLADSANPVFLALDEAAKKNRATDSLNLANINLPTALLPQGKEFNKIEDFEEFPDIAYDIASKEQSSCVFAYLPIMYNQRYSEGWRERYGRLELAESLAEVLFDKPKIKIINEYVEEEDSKILISTTRTSPKYAPNKIECIVLLTPKNLSTGLRCSRWRKDFFPNHSATIIEHGHQGFLEMLGLNANNVSEFCTVILKREPGPIRFFKITDAAISEGPEKIAKDLCQLLRQPAGKTKFGYVYTGPLHERYPCSYDFYSEETEKLRQEVSVLGAKVPLSSVADILIGFTHQAPGHEQSGNSRFLRIGTQNITMDGRVDLTEVSLHEKRANIRTYLQDGDFCVREFVPNNGRLVIGVFESDGRAITATPNIIIVRPHPTLSPAQRMVLLAFLRSTIGYRLVDAKQTSSRFLGALRIMPHVLKDFPVPIADEELSSSLEQLESAKSAFTSWIQQIERESNAIIEEATAAGSRARLLNAGRLARQRHRAGEQVEELDYRIRTQFPHPLAYAWRKLQVAGNDRYHRLDAILQAAESHTCFMALVAILISRSIKQPIKWIDEIAKRLSDRKNGTNFGDWIAILQEINQGKNFQPHKSNLPFAEIAEVHADQTWSTAISKLKKWRDDDCHQRISTTNVPEALLKEAEKALEKVYQVTDFLTDYRFIFITEARFDSIRKINRYQYLDLTGDNTLAQRHEDQANCADLESNLESQSLYLIDRKGQLHLFRPLLHYLECPECHLMSTFFLDTFDSSESLENVGLKSFETNSVRIEPFAEEFRHIGLICKLPRQ